MELLDLSIHDRDDYEGKAIECRGRRYVIGQRLASVRADRGFPDQRAVGLSILVIKLLKIPRPRGVTTYPAVTQRHRAGTGDDPDAGVDVPGGMVEIQPNVESRGADPQETRRQGSTP